MDKLEQLIDAVATDNSCVLGVHGPYVIDDSRFISGRRVSMAVKRCTSCGTAFGATEQEALKLEHVAKW